MAFYDFEATSYNTMTFDFLTPVMFSNLVVDVMRRYMNSCGLHYVCDILVY